MRHPLFCLIVLATLFCAGGASCPGILRPKLDPPPVLFAETPTRQKVIDIINAQSDRIQSLETTGAWLSLPGMPSLRTDIAMERPRRFRLQARTSVTGAELDLGSNDELFWFWVQRNQPPATYFCRHDQFRHSAARHVLPVRPEWLMEALGVVSFDPAHRHEGPYASGIGRFQMHSKIPSDDGEMTKVTVIDVYGQVHQQQLYDNQGRLLASAVASKHRYDRVRNVSLPRHVEIRLPPANLSFSIDVTGYAINHISGDPAQLWSMPQIEGYPLVDLSDPRLQPLQDPGPNRVPPSPALPQYSATGARRVPPPYGVYPRRR